MNAVIYEIEQSRVECINDSERPPGGDAINVKIDDGRS
jgi:hypothetical protein